MSKISYKFFGRNLDNSFENVIITNIRSIYLEIINNSEIINQSEGFYKCSLVNLNRKKYLIIKINPGNVIIDVLKIIGDVAKNISLVGLAGSLNDKYLIGSIVFPRAFVDLDNSNKIVVFNNTANGGLICQTDGLVQNDNFYFDLIKKGVDFVDMESSFFVNFCKKNNIQSRIIAIISDLPLKYNFYENDFFSKKYFKKIVINLIKSYL